MCNRSNKLIIYVREGDDEGGRGGRNSFRKRISPCRRIILLQRQRYYIIYTYYANATDRHTHTHIHYNIML